MIQPASLSAQAVRCAIYTRKSTEEGLEQAFNSLQAQREACEAYVASQRHDGWTVLPTPYDDGGFSGGNTDRPALQRLLEDIEADKVDVVLCYKLDRLSRSLADFVRLMEIFEAHGTSFVSVTQRFDTKSSMGRLVLNVLLSFAQFERELTVERVRDKIAAAKKKGKYVGGRPVLGYDVDRERRRLIVNAEEADLVRHIFQRFLQLASCRLVARELNRQGHRTKAWTARSGKERGGSPWNKSYVHWTLTNRRYVGEVMHQGQAYPGEHEAIIDRRTWDRVHALLGENRRYRATQTRKKTAAILKGLLRCGSCGKPMAPAQTTARRGRRYQYYVCHAASKNGHDTCPVKSVPAREIEGAVFDYLRALFADPEMVARTFRATAAQAAEERGTLAREKAAIERRLDGLRKTIGRLVRTTGGQTEGALADELRRLNAEYAEAEQQLREVEAQIDSQGKQPTERDVAAALRTIDPLWKELFPAEKERVVRLLFESVTVRPDGLSVRLKPGGLTALAAEGDGTDTEATA